MRIVEIREAAVPLRGAEANALVSFAGHTVSLVAVVTDVQRDGRPVTGVAFGSIGRFAQSGILRDRMIPRVLAADPGTLLDATGAAFDPAAVAAAALTDEKPGGHGDRATAAAALELAVWDANAKLADEPAYATVARHFGRPLPGGAAPEVEAYAAGGYYYPEGSGRSLSAELRRYRDMGFTSFKIKIGGAPLTADLARVETALAVAGDGSALAVDANGRFGTDDALRYAKALRGYGLRWYEEPGDPLDYRLLADTAAVYPLPLATGENLFSTADVRNLLRYGGLRQGTDLFQMDAGLSYGATEYAAMLDLLEEHGFARTQARPHGGHLINLHLVAALGAGGCEAYPGVFEPFGGYPRACLLGGGLVRPPQAPGFGLELMPGLREEIAALTA
ncbi:enolase C-terminal domain-like protein [Streptomyces sp. NPDC047002]|uniref:enolase C-terminal domain-like protein n=1 Tax=Streptomyces sp. NPDC047002 TaxID=3155475 RepID=UPI0034548FDA